MHLDAFAAAFADGNEVPPPPLIPLPPLLGVQPILIGRSAGVQAPALLSNWQRASGVPVFVVASLFWTALFCAVLS